MSRILHLNTALSKAFVGISDGKKILGSLTNEIQMEHGSFLQPAIKQITTQLKISLKEVDAVSVINGPGSYTGLRVGLSAAKGICFALNKPLISLSTLEWLAQPFNSYIDALICPMIDARRMEVFTAIYESGTMKEYFSPQALIIDENSFPLLQTHKIVFTGNGRNKLPASISEHPNAVFPDNESGLEHQIHMANLQYKEKNFSDLAYVEPLYLKPFYSTLIKK